MNINFPFLDYYIFIKNRKYLVVLYSQISGFNLFSLRVPIILPGKVANPFTSLFAHIE